MTDRSPQETPCERCEGFKREALEILAHLGAAISQSIPEDDQIIMQHVRDAKTLAEAALRRFNA